MSLISELLAHRGVDAGYAMQLMYFSSRALIDGFIERGPEGVRMLCRVGSSLDEPMTEDEIVARLVAHRKATYDTIHEIVATGTVATGLPLAVRTIGYWDEPRSVELALAIAVDPTRERVVRDEAIDALCQLEAPEAIDLLCATLTDPDVQETIPWRCATALGNIGNTAALPALEAISKAHPRGDLGSRARDAIAKIKE
jgi:hypothetical protein